MHSFTKILVTGGAGFIGSNLVEALLKQGVKVVVLDNFLTGKRENLADFAHHPDFTLIEGDVRDFTICRKAVTGCDAVLHEAALGSVPRSMRDPQTTLAINVQGFLNVIEAARQEKVRRFVYASSSSVYGNDAHIPKIEEYVGKALSPYAYSKQCNEAAAALYERIYGLSTIGLRYFNVFGRRQDPQGAYAAIIPKFVQTLLRHESPTINGDGSYSRDFTCVDNVVQANLLALRSERSGFVCNVARGERTTLNELFAFLKEDLSAFDPEIADVEAAHGPNRAGDIPHSLACIDKARRLLGYEPEVSVKTGLQDAVRWYLENFAGSAATPGAVQK